MSVPTFPSDKYLAVTPSDTAKITAYTSGDASKGVTIDRCRALYIGGAGNIVVKNDKGDSITFAGIPAGTILPISVDQVLATSTTATSIVALY